MVPKDYQQYEAKQRLARQVLVISAMLKAATDELCGDAHAEELFVDDRIDEFGDPLNRVFNGLMRHTERARAELSQCLVVLEHWHELGP